MSLVQYHSLVLGKNILPAKDLEGKVSEKQYGDD